MEPVNAAIQRSCMCGRYIDASLRGTESELSEIKINPFPRRYNIKPTQEVYVLRDGAFPCARRGLIPSWTKKGTLKDWRVTTPKASPPESAREGNAGQAGQNVTEHECANQNRQILLSSGGE
ncbi:SOS response-associated peptidase family protein [Roseinatronobacter alkalisoli]|uniref:Chemokine interleukin-8-like domain-containing protein n=1 Tax=Roseinatronobacter alkalisoli TaxID=3028235 RepID=A0ABT5T8F6_9RHOB|nr:SOS response-associated peptidase family protein [Roseinatronobacter sp. HJB301]MDD7971413.1 hypothetical protein [Roseinatronobacter sp. HJB301]